MSKNIIYVCAVLQLQGLRKKPFESGEVVVAENFPAGHFEKLIASGHITPKEVDTTEADKAAAEAAALAEKEAADKAAAEAEAAALELAEGKGKPKK